MRATSMRVTSMRVTSWLWLAPVALLACADRRAGDARDSSAGTRAQADPAARLRATLGSTWELARLGEQAIPPSRAASGARTPGTHPGPGTRPTIRFTSEPAAQAADSGMSSAGGWSFCNGYGAAYRAGPADQLRFGLIQSTLVGCDGADSLETRFFRALAATRRFALESATLVLIAEDGSRLTFVLAPDSARSSRSP